MSDPREFPRRADERPPAMNWPGFLLVFLIPVFGLLCCCGGGFAFLYSTARYSALTETHDEAIRRAVNDPRVKELLGERIERGTAIIANYAVVNGAAETQWQFPLTGRKGEGRLHAIARRGRDRWEFSELEVRLADGRVIDLLSQ